LTYQAYDTTTAQAWLSTAPLDRTKLAGRLTQLRWQKDLARPGCNDDAEMPERLGKPSGIAALVELGQDSAVKREAVPVEFCLGDWLIV
jgi:hypothetical protein